MQHWFVLTKDIQTHVYVIVMLLTEFVWEWEVIFNVGQYPCHSWNIKLIACTMLVAHWLYLSVMPTQLFPPNPRLSAPLCAAFVSRSPMHWLCE